MKVSYCITCKGRLYHLDRTLPLNLAAEAGDPDVEFVILDYQSEDGLGDWLHRTYPDEIASGRIVHAYHFPAPHFRMAHAKNLAHRIATGGILCNVDADNILVPGYAAALRALFGRHGEITASSRELGLHGFYQERVLARLFGWPRPSPGSHGRIAVSRAGFERLGGYDEQFSAWGSDDVDFQLRGRDAGIRPVRTPPELWGSVIVHGDEERLSNLAASDEAISSKRLGETIFVSAYRSARRTLATHAPYPNTGGRYGMGMVRINNAPDPTVLGIAVVPIAEAGAAAVLSSPVTGIRTLGADGG